MRARGWVAASCVLSATALAAPKPTPVDIKPFRGEALVLTDAKGGIYVVHPGPGEHEVFYGNKTTLNQQRVLGYSANGEAGTWSIATDAPRLANLQHGAIAKMPDGTYQRQCDGKDDAVLSEVTGDKAKAILDKSQFLTTSMFYVSVLLARDDTGVYYYVDRNRVSHQDYRVFVGKKGAMKQLPLTDVAVDDAGAVFSTKSGDLRLVETKDDEDTVGVSKKSTARWVHGEKKEELTFLSTELSERLIFRDLGVYAFLGTLCDNV
jgi:hypothetical protein